MHPTTLRGGELEQAKETRGFPALSIWYGDQRCVPTGLIQQIR
jgi:hypothetical protein